MKVGKSKCKDVIALCTQRLISMGCSFSNAKHEDYRHVLYILKQNLAVYEANQEEQEELNKIIQLVKERIIGGS